ncbi:hypothetical protein [Peribacillus sp. FSL E2-0159]|uniref:hypothetical protein n=1 Tax=Peribacillus sp. FSL E2-0159 TaxID=2975289 RepID=UPI00315A70E1
MEPSGHYWVNLSKWQFKQKIDVVTVNPHHAKETKKIVIIRNPKVIKKYALVIPDVVKNGYYTFVRSISESLEKTSCPYSLPRCDR